MKTEPNEPINPSVVKVKCDYAGDKTAEAMLPEFENKQLPGLTKREYFAAMAMQGMLPTGAQTESSGKTNHPSSIATLAVNQADALIEALNIK